MVTDSAMVPRSAVINIAGGDTSERIGDGDNYQLLCFMLNGHYYDKTRSKKLLVISSTSIIICGLLIKMR